MVGSIDRSSLSRMEEALNQKNLARQRALRLEPKAVCRFNSKSGFYIVSAHGKALGAGPIPLDAWRAAYNTMMKKAHEIADRTLRSRCKKLISFYGWKRLSDGAIVQSHIASSKDLLFEITGFGAVDVDKPVKGFLAVEVVNVDGEYKEAECL